MQSRPGTLPVNSKVHSDHAIYSPIYVGVTGLPAAGKTTAASFLIAELTSRGIETYFFGMSDEVRREAAKLNSKYDREDLQRVSLSLKQRYGAGVLAVRTIEDVQRVIESGTRPRVVVTEAIRNYQEVVTFRSTLGGRFLLAAVVAPPDTLVDRIVLRRRQDESSSVRIDRAKILDMIHKELGEGESEFGHQVGKCIEAADIVLENAGFEDLRKQVRIFLDDRIVPLMQTQN
jgi:dephospho-CoA kinase